MSEVTAWSATDNANTAAPPDGWPEGQQPSSVNDCGRMMMGALRREHDRITAQIGSVAGTISTTNITAVSINATGAITASGPITAGALNSTGNASVAGTLTAGALTASGNIAGGGFTTAGNVVAGGTVQGAFLRSTGNADIDGSLNVDGNIGCTFNINAGANITAVGTVQGGYVTSTGNVNCAADLTCGHDVYAQSGHVYSNLIFPNGDNQGGVGDIGRAYQAMFSYNYVTASDARVKTDIATATECLPLVEAIAPRTYRFREGADEGQHWGFIAQEVGAAMQAAGREFAGHRVDRESGAEGLAYNEMIAVLWSAVRDLAQQVEALKREKADV